MTSSRSDRSLWLIVAVLTVAALVPRVVNLGELSFYGDEETTAFPAKAVATGQGPEMPTGMSYRRALPLTYLNAASARVFGLESEFAYRLPAAVFGTLTVPLLFLFGRRYVGDSAALVGATLLLVSEWHLVHSRMARMYAPFLFIFVLAVWSVWHWARKDDLRSLVLAIAAVVAAFSFHTFGLFAIVLAGVPVVLPRWKRAESWKIAIFLVVGLGIGWLARRFHMVQLGEAPTSLEQSGVSSSWQVTALAPDPWAWLVVTAGACLGAWAAVRVLGSESDRGSHDLVRQGGLVLTLAGAFAFAFAGLPYGAGMFLVLFLVAYSDGISVLARRAWPHLALAAAVCGAQITADASSLGLVESLKQALIFPFPHAGYFVREFPAVSLVVVLTGAWLFVRPVTEERDERLRMVFVAMLVPLVVIGMLKQWGPMRYLWPVYPFFLLVAAAGLVGGARKVVRRLRWPSSPVAIPATLILIVIAGAFPNHGVPAAVATATLDHGEPVDADLHQQPFRPDHEGAGEFVRSARRPGDVLIAEDPLQQRWYAGEVDYWFRSHRDASPFLYIAEKGWIRDFYVNSVLVESVQTIDSVREHADERAWFVTSGETTHLRGYYLDSLQARWLDSLENARRPAHVARDSVTAVYCINCRIGSTEN